MPDTTDTEFNPVWPNKAIGATNALDTVVPNSTVDALHGLVPEFDDPRKQEYLVLRACSFSNVECLGMLGISQTRLDQWKYEDKEFNEWYYRHSRTIQLNLGPMVLRAKFMRNVLTVLNIDAELLTKRMFDPQDMTAQERDEVKESLKRYSASNIAQMIKVLDISSGDGQVQQKANVDLSIHVGVDDVDIQISRHAAARNLLNAFSSNKEIIDAESEVVN